MARKVTPRKARSAEALPPPLAVAAPEPPYKWRFLGWLDRVISDDGEPSAFRLLLIPAVVVFLQLAVLDVLGTTETRVTVAMVQALRTTDGAISPEAIDAIRSSGPQFSPALVTGFVYVIGILAVGSFIRKLGVAGIQALGSLLGGVAAMASGVGKMIGRTRGRPDDDERDPTEGRYHE